MLLMRNIRYLRAYIRVVIQMIHNGAHGVEQGLASGGEVIVAFYAQDDIAAEGKAQSAVAFVVGTAG